MTEVKAVRIREAGGPEVLELATLDVRDPGPHEVRVKVAAAGVNRADVMQRKGFYPAPDGAPPDVPGLEIAGTVESVGAGVRAFEVGQPVMTIVGGGGLAELAVVHERELLSAPEGLSLTDAAALPEVYLTAYDALFLQGGAALGQTVLVHAVASGVGTAALQLLRHAGCRVVGTSRSEDKLARCRELGLAHAIDTSDGLFAEKLAALAPAGADLVLDTVGAKYANEDLRALRPKGTIVTIGLVGGRKGEVDLGLLLRKRATWIGTVLRTRPLEEKATLIQRFAREVLPLLEDGTLKPVVDAVLPMAEAAEAHRRMEANATFGKLVLAW
ncbi:MAG: NAD(P)H-quinone oxidoreductase [Myxococcota bacterium]